MAAARRKSQPQQQEERATKKDETAFSQHAQQDSALTTESANGVPPNEGMSFVAKVLIFLGFPLLMGTAGLYLSYVKTITDQQRKIDFDTDFVFPFLLALALVVVIYVQTKGFTKKKITPLVQWPTVRRKRKIVRKRVIVDDDGNEIQQEIKEDWYSEWGKFHISMSVLLNVTSLVCETTGTMGVESR